MFLLDGEVNNKILIKWLMLFCVSVCDCVCWDEWQGVGRIDRHVTPCQYLELARQTFAEKTDLRENIQLLNNVPQRRVHVRWMAGENFEWVRLSSLLFLFLPPPSSFSPAAAAAGPSLAPCYQSYPVDTFFPRPSFKSWTGGVMCWETIGVVTVGGDLRGRQMHPTA